MGSEIYFLFFTMKFWWKMSLAIVFSELTCINGDCLIKGQWREGGEGGGGDRSGSYRVCF